MEVLSEILKYYDQISNINNLNAGLLCKMSKVIYGLHVCQI